MHRYKALWALSGIISAIAFLFATLLLFVPIGEFGSVSSPAEYRGSVYDLMEHVSWLGESDKELGSRRNLVVFLYLLFAVGLMFALISLGRANRISSVSENAGSALTIGSQPSSKSSGHNYKRCQFCAEVIQSAAVYCKHCKRDQILNTP